MANRKRRASSNKASGSSVGAKWKALADCIADLLGPEAEVVVHDVRFPEHSIVMIRNGHVTGRQVGDPLTDLGFYMLRQAQKGIDSLGVYHSRTETGKQLKCNATNLRNDRGQVEAILCINLGVSKTSPPIPANREEPEHYHTDISEVIRTMISQTLREAGPDGDDIPPNKKPELIRALCDRGVFLARGAVKQVSATLKIAPPTVYKYIRKAQKSSLSRQSI